MSRRLSVLLIAITLGLVGVVAVGAYVRRVQSRANASETTGPAKTVTVLAAKATIPAGTSGAAAVQGGLVQQQTLPANLLPPGALADITPVQGMFALNDIAPNQVLLTQMFAAQTQTGALTIPNGLMAVTIQLTDAAARVAGFVTPGSDVAIFDTYQSAPSVTTTRLLLPRVQLIAVGPVALTKTQPAAAAVATTYLTLALNQRESEKVIEAASTTGKLSFALLTPRSKTAPSAGVTASTLFQ